MFFNKAKYGFKDIGLVTDVHSHILPGVDDGAQTIEDSVAIIRTLHEAGVRNFSLTPHVSCGLFPNRASDLQKRFDSLLEAIPQELKEGTAFKLAAEYMIDEALDDKLSSARSGASSAPLTFPDGSILIEMSYQSRSPQLLETVFDLVQDGYKPILAHPERYEFYFTSGRVKALTELEKLVEMGCRLQLNIQSLTGCYGRGSLDNLKYLLDHDLYSFVATDIHSARQFSHFGNFSISASQLEKVQSLVSNNQRLF